MFAARLRGVFARGVSLPERSSPAPTPARSTGELRGVLTAAAAAAAAAALGLSRDCTVTTPGLWVMLLLVLFTMDRTTVAAVAAVAASGLLTATLGVRVMSALHGAGWGLLRVRGIRGTTASKPAELPSAAVDAYAAVLSTKPLLPSAAGVYSRGGVYPAPAAAAEDAEDPGCRTEPVKGSAARAAAEP